MKALEQSVMTRTGVTGDALMERAAGHVAEAVRQRLRGRRGQTLCLCGTGNNGGDGLAAMRLLGAEGGFTGSCWLLPGELSPQAQRQLNRLRHECPHIQICVLETDALPELNPPVACVIDALFGTGLSRPLSGLAAALCRMSNGLYDSGVPVIAVDIPSGLNGDSGTVCGEAITATETVTFHRPKPGLYLGEGLDRAGAVRTCGIGLPPAMDDVPGFDVLEPGDLSRLLPARKRVSHKGSYGRVLCWAGQRGMAGAAAICATAALRTGAGLTTVACPDSIVDTVQALCPCAMCLPLPPWSAPALAGGAQGGNPEYSNPLVDGMLTGSPLVGGTPGGSPQVSNTLSGNPQCGSPLAGGVQCNTPQNLSFSGELPQWECLRTGMDRANAFALGCGLGQSAATAAMLGHVLAYLSRRAEPLPTVIDADGLNLLAGLNDKELEAARPGLHHSVLTPHPAEAARLLGCTCAEAAAAPVEAAVRLHEKYGAAVVMKGAVSVLIAREGMALNVLGTPAMAKGGSGDALTGVLAALLAGRAAGAYAMNDLELLQAACGLHGLAGITAAKRVGERGLLATELCAALGTVEG